MTFEEFKKLPIDEQWNYVDNCQGQRDESLARIEAYDAEKADLAKKAADELKAAQDKAASDLAAAQDKAASDLAAAQDKATADLAAAKATHDTEKADLTKKAADELKAAQDKAVADLAAAKASHDAAIASLTAAHKAVVDEKTQQLADAQALIDVLGSTELGQKLQRQKEREKLLAEIAQKAKEKSDAEAKLATIPVEVV